MGSCTRLSLALQREWHRGSKQSRQEFWTDVVHNTCKTLLDEESTEQDEVFRGHLKRLSTENNVPRKRWRLAEKEAEVACEC